MNFNKKKLLSDFNKNQASYEEIHDNIIGGMDVTGANFIILMCAILIASVGLNMNATAVIIGAMLISPLMGSIIAIGYSLGTYNSRLLNKAIIVLLLSVAVSLFTSTIYFIITPITTAGSEILSRTSPTIWDVIIAFTGGIAGIIGITRDKPTNVIPGVAIATALMPPLCTAGYGIANGNLRIFIGAFYLFFINCFFITTATVIITKILNLPNKGVLSEEKQEKAKRYIIVAIIIIIIPTMISAVSIIKDTIYDNNLNSFIKNELVEQYVLQKKIDKNTNTITLALVGKTISSDKEAELQNKLSNYGLSEMTLEIKQTEESLSDFEKYFNQLMNKNNGFIRDNTTYKNNKENQNENQNIDIDEISKEIKIIYPEIQKVYTGYITNEEGKETAMLILISEKDELKEQKITIENWFKEKVGKDNVAVYFAKQQ